MLQCGPHNLGRNDKKKNNTALQAVLSLELEEVIKQGRLTKGQGWHPAAEKKQSPAPAPAPARSLGRKGFPGSSFSEQILDSEFNNCHLTFFPLPTRSPGRYFPNGLALFSLVLVSDSLYSDGRWGWGPQSISVTSRQNVSN